MNDDIRAAITAAEAAAEGDSNDQEIDALWTALRLCEAALTPEPVPEPKPVVVDAVTGELSCPECGSNEIQVSGHVPCWWTFGAQDTEGKQLHVHGWEWGSSESTSIDCVNCLTDLSIPDDWEIVYN